MTRVRLVIGPAAAPAGPLMHALTRRGIDLERVWTGDDPAATPNGPPDVSVICDDDELADYPWPVLRLAWERDAVQIGPQVRRPGETACARCVRRSIKDSGLVSGAPQDADFLLDSCERVADAVCRLNEAPPRGMLRITPAGKVARYLVVPYPDCDVCGWVPGAEPLATAYEWQMERPAEPACVPAIRAMRIPAPPRAGTRIRHRLPRPAPWSAQGRLDQPVLASLLNRTVGRRRGGRRWAPSAGDLGSPAAWVVTDLLDGGPLRYDDGALVGPGRPATSAQVLAETDLACPARTIVIVTADPFPLLPKYGRFAYRLAVLDAGCAAMQLAIVAQAHGLRVSFAASWTAAIGDLLGTVSIAAIAAIEE